MKIEYILSFLVFFPFVAGLLAYVSGGKGCGRMAVAAMAAEALGMLAMVFLVFGGGEALSARSFLLPGACGFGLHFRVDGFRLVYSCLSVFMWLMAAVFSGEYFRLHAHVERFYLFLFWTLGATMGIFLSADFYTTFVFFEIMSFTSYAWVAQEENRPSLRAAQTYLAVSVIGGLVMLMGIFLLYYIAGEWGLYTPGQPLYFEDLKGFFQTVLQGKLTGAGGGVAPSAFWLWAAGFCMLFGFAAKAGAFPLHIWLPKAYPAAPAPASALLSSILTKTGIFGILALSCNLFLYEKVWGSVLLAVGVVTMLGGALLAVASIDLKRTLACSSMSQIGFILVGIGMLELLGEENQLAVYGTALHMINHSLIKLVLFMAAGVVYMNAHALDLNVIRGFGRKKPLLKGIFLIGALAVGGIPLFGGYVSKTLLHESIVGYGGGGLMTAVEWIFLFSGGLTVAYMLKLFVAVFVEENRDRALQEKYDGMRHYMNGGSTFALAGSGLLLFVWGLFPHGLMEKVAEMMQGFMRFEGIGHTVQYFSFGNLKGGLISIGIGVLVYLFFVRGAMMGETAGYGEAGQEDILQPVPQKGGLAAGQKIYVNLWPAWLDLEERLYRPVLLKVLPAVFGVLCRVMDSLLDGIIVALRKTVYRDSPLPCERPEGNAFTSALGKAMNGMEALGNYMWNRNHPKTVDYVHLMAIRYEELRENNRMIQRSLSFGLLLSGIGLCLTLVYLIWW